MLGDIFYAAVLLFFIFDPLASLPIFISLTKGSDARSRVHSANMAVLVAVILFLIFVFVGKQLLEAFGISIEGFQVAGGLVLLLMALEVIFGMEMMKRGEQNVAWVIIATPVLSGPGVITTSILLVNEYGYMVTIIAGSIALFITWLFFRNAPRILDFLGSTTVDIFGRIIGLLIAALGIEFILDGVFDYIELRGVELVLLALSHL
jgi:multiple antibiotic resistance protein